MKTNVLLLVVVLGLVLGTCLPGARAQSPLPDCAGNPACASLFEQGRAQSGAGNLAEALRLYQRAYATEPDPDLLFSIGRVLHKQGRPAEAATYYRRFLASASPAQEQRRKAQEYLAEFQSAGATATTGLTGAQKNRAAAATRPVYKKWWFWTILGTVAAAGIAGGIAGGVITRNQQCEPPLCFLR